MSTTAKLATDVTLARCFHCGCVIDPIKRHPIRTKAFASYPDIRTLASIRVNVCSPACMDMNHHAMLNLLASSGYRVV